MRAVDENVQEDALQQNAAVNAEATNGPEADEAGTTHPVDHVTTNHIGTPAVESSIAPVVSSTTVKNVPIVSDKIATSSGTTEEDDYDDSTAPVGQQIADGTLPKPSTALVTLLLCTLTTAFL